MGQKKVIKKTEEESIKEGEQLKTLAAKKGEISEKQSGKKVDIGRIYINASYNNTILTAADIQGNVLSWISSGSLGFSGPKKATPFASSKMVSAVSDKLKKIGLINIEIMMVVLNQNFMTRIIMNMEENQKIEFEISKLVVATYNKIAHWINNDYDTERQKSDALKIVSQDIVQNALEELLSGLNLKTNTEVSRGGIKVGDVDSIKDAESFAKTNEKDVLNKLFDKK